MNENRNKKIENSSQLWLGFGSKKCSAASSDIFYVTLRSCNVSTQIITKKIDF
jgi:hypothetical protein